MFESLPYHFTSGTTLVQLLKQLLEVLGPPLSLPGNFAIRRVVYEPRNVVRSCTALCEHPEVHALYSPVDQEPETLE